MAKDRRGISRSLDPETDAWLEELGVELAKQVSETAKPLPVPAVVRYLKYQYINGKIGKTTKGSS